MQHALWGIRIIFQKNMFWPKIVKFYNNTKYFDFTSNFNPFKCLNMISNLKRPFLKKRCAIYLSYDNWSYFRNIFGGWWANWFKLGSAQPNFQTKRKVIVLDLNSFYQTFLIYLIWWWRPRWRTHGGHYMCEVVFFLTKFRCGQNYLC